MKATIPKSLGEDDDLSDASDDLLSDFDHDMDSGDENTGEDDDNTLALVGGSDHEDLISLDGDIHEGLLGYRDSESSDHGEEWGGIDTNKDKKGTKRKHDDASREKRKKLKLLPTFASYEDYAKIIEDGAEDHL
jgi:ribosome biogenesis protein MAK21